MHIDKNNPEASWISLILRLAMASMFALATYGKFADFGKYVNMIMAMFKDTFLPNVLLTPYVYALPFAEGLIVVWLLVGIRLRAAWVFTSLVLLSLAFGLMVAKQSAADSFLFLLIACVGLYVSKYDGCFLGGCSRK